MNGPHTPVFSRNNRWTQLIERAGQQNAQDGKPAGRVVEQMANATPLISAARVRRMSPAEARRTDFVPPPEDPTIALRASARAAALGITNDLMPQPGDDLPADIGRVAGEPTDAEIDAMLAAAKGGELPGVATAAEGAAAPGTQGPAAANRVRLPRGVAPQPVGLTGPRTMMPNFANVEGFDLTRKVVVVDGMEFKLAAEDALAMKKFAIKVVLDNITYELAQALITLGIPEEMAKTTAEQMRKNAGATGDGSGKAETVQEVPAREATNRVQVAPSGLQKVPESSGSGASEERTKAKGDAEAVQPQREKEGVEAKVQSDNQGSSGSSERSFGEGREADDSFYLFGDSGASPS